MWLNPPRHDEPHEDVIIELHPASAAAAANALAEAADRAEEACDRADASLLRHVADDIEAASVTPAAASDAELWRQASWHPANIMACLTPAAIRNAARYQGPAYTASTAIEAAAAIAWSAGGQAAKEEFLDHCRHAIDSTAATSYPPRRMPCTPSHDPAPPATTARAARRRILGLPAASATQDARGPRPEAGGYQQRR
jgi:hypothetical protein